MSRRLIDTAEVASDSRPNLRFTVELFSDGTRECNCEAFVFCRDKKKHCKHLSRAVFEGKLASKPENAVMNQSWMQIGWLSRH